MITRALSVRILLLNKTSTIIDKQGNILGKHNGIVDYTIGQRKGLGISSKEPLYVVG